MGSIFKGLLAAAALTALASAPANATIVVPLVEGGGWSEFFFQGPGSLFQDGNTGEDFQYTFTLAHKSVLRVTDGFNDGDQFDVVINGIDKGPTSTPALDFTDAGTCWSCAFFMLGASFSHAAYKLQAGVYNVEGSLLQAPYGSGSGAIALGVVPEPATWAMMMLGFGGLGLAARRRRAALAA
jgi:hypothetical protein